MRALIFACALLGTTAQAATCTATSGPVRAALLELYTSEGCSSCPPADRWLSRLPADGSVVPLAFHVDYWDRLGWTDRFAQAAFSERQRARNRRSGWVYTPQVMLDGADYRDWQRTSSPHLPARAARVEIGLRLDAAADHVEARVTSRFASSATAAGAELFLALFENRLRSEVTKGENARRTLEHDYVVRALAGPLAPNAGHRFDLEPGWKRADLGVAAFLLTREGATLQALARPFCRE